MNRVRCCVIVMFVVGLSSHSLKADVRADQKSHVEFGGMLGRMVNLFGGKAAREGVTQVNLDVRFALRAGLAVRAGRRAALGRARRAVVFLAMGLPMRLFQGRKHGGEVARNPALGLMRILHRARRSGGTCVG